MESFKIEFCTQCHVWQISCPECKMGGCSGGHIPGCSLVDEELELSKALDLLIGKTDLESLLDHVV